MYVLNTIALASRHTDCATLQNRLIFSKTACLEAIEPFKTRWDALSGCLARHQSLHRWSALQRLMLRHLWGSWWALRDDTLAWTCTLWFESHEFFGASWHFSTQQEPRRSQTDHIFRWDWCWLAPAPLSTLCQNHKPCLANPSALTDQQALFGWPCCSLLAQIQHKQLVQGQQPSGWWAWDPATNT